MEDLILVYRDASLVYYTLEIFLKLLSVILISVSVNKTTDNSIFMFIKSTVDGMIQWRHMEKKSPVVYFFLNGTLTLIKDFF